MSFQRIVIDTSTLISAALNEGSIPDQAMLVVIDRCTLCSCVETLDELREVLCRKKFDSYISLDTRNEFLEKISLASQIFNCFTSDSSFSQPLCRDVKDQKFLELARIASAEVIISSDADLLELNPWNGILILRPKNFLELYSARNVE
jgi:putative PIN family toxin of toxin-antitoxin system